MHDAGVCALYETKFDEAGVVTPKRTLHLLGEHYFEERTVGITRHYAAAKNGERVDRLIRIWRTPVSARCICSIDGVEYNIRQVQPTTNQDGLMVTDLALEMAGEAHENPC